MAEPQEQTKIALTVPNSLLAIIGNENLYYFDKIKKKKIKKLFGGFQIRKIAITNLAIYNLDSDVIIYANTDGYTVNVSMQKIKQSN